MAGLIKKLKRRRKLRKAKAIGKEAAKAGLRAGAIAAAGVLVREYRKTRRGA